MGVCSMATRVGGGHGQKLKPTDNRWSGLLPPHCCLHLFAPSLTSPIRRSRRDTPNLSTSSRPYRPEEGSRMWAVNNPTRAPRIPSTHRRSGSHSFL